MQPHITGTKINQEGPEGAGPVGSDAENGIVFGHGSALAVRESEINRSPSGRGVPKRDILDADVYPWVRYPVPGHCVTAAGSAAKGWRPASPGSAGATAASATSATTTAARVAPGAGTVRWLARWSVAVVGTVKPG